MNTLIRHIEYIISRKDCVIIPGIGAILAKHESARIVKSTGLLLPPRRAFTFNKEIDHNDGTLAWSIARAESISYETACKKMESEIGSILHWLHSQGQISVGKIGVLKYNKEEDIIQFEPYVRSDYISDKGALETFELSYKNRINNKSIKVDIENNDTTRLSSLKFRGIARIAASIAIILGVCFIAYQPVSREVDEPMKASLAPKFSKPQIDHEDEMLDSQLLIYKSDKYKTYSEIEAVSVDCSHSSISSDSVDLKETSDSKIQRYYVIVAAFRTEHEANRFLSFRPEESLHVMQYKKLYVVYSSEWPSKNEAYKNCCKIVSRYPGAWICRN